ARASGAAELLGVQARNQAVTESGFERAAAFCNAESHALAETVDELGKPGLRRRRDQPSRHQVNVSSWPLPVFRRNRVCCKRPRAYIALVARRLVTRSM